MNVFIAPKESNPCLQVVKNWCYHCTEHQVCLLKSHKSENNDNNNEKIVKYFNNFEFCISLVLKSDLVMWRNKVAGSDLFLKQTIL